MAWDHAFNPTPTIGDTIARVAPWRSDADEYGDGLCAGPVNDQGGTIPVWTTSGEVQYLPLGEAADPGHWLLDTVRAARGGTTPTARRSLRRRLVAADGDRDTAKRRARAATLQRDDALERLDRAEADRNSLRARLDAVRDLCDDAEIEGYGLLTVADVLAALDTAAPILPTGPAVTGTHHG